MLAAIKKKKITIPKKQSQNKGLLVARITVQKLWGTFCGTTLSSGSGTKVPSIFVMLLSSIFTKERKERAWTMIQEILWLGLEAAHIIFAHILWPLK